MRYLVTFIFSFISTLTLGQLTNASTISSSSSTTIATNGSVLNTGRLMLEGELVLDGNGQIQSNNVLSIPTLSFISGNYSLIGTLQIGNSLSLGGVLSTQSEARLIIESSASVDAQDGGYVNGPLYHRGTGDKFYPIGSGDRYTPVSLAGIQGDNNTLVGVQSINTDIGLSAGTLPVAINEVSADWYWQIISEGLFNGAQVALPILSEDASLFSGDNVRGVVLEANADRSTATNLGRGNGSDNTQVVSRDITVGPAVVIGVENVVELVIRNLITPNGDNQNDYLFIENLDLIEGTKKVYFLDRWGSRVGVEINTF
ncbi:MAG: gliding motility-associated C-terminal domain-containing protein, partial [Bacteroidota bacterium]